MHIGVVLYFGFHLYGRDIFISGTLSDNVVQQLKKFDVFPQLGMFLLAHEFFFSWSVYVDLFSCTFCTFMLVMTLHMGMCAMWKRLVFPYICGFCKYCSM